MKILFRNIRSGKRRAAITGLNNIARKKLEKAIDKKVKPSLIKSHELIVVDWEHKPKFAARKYIEPNRIAVSVYPTGQYANIWFYVNFGTKPHKIAARNAPMLVFPWGGPGSYVSKTLAKPARTVRGGGYVKNPTLQFRKQVNHPGTQAREFTKELAEDFKPEFKKTIENTFREIARAIEE